MVGHVDWIGAVRGPDEVAIIGESYGDDIALVDIHGGWGVMAIPRYIIFAFNFDRYIQGRAPRYVEPGDPLMDRGPLEDIAAWGAGDNDSGAYCGVSAGWHICRKS